MQSLSRQSDSNKQNEILSHWQGVIAESDFPADAYFLNPVDAFEVSQGRTKRGILEGIRHRREASQLMLERLQAVDQRLAPEKRKRAIKALQLTIAKCNSPKNHWAAEDLTTVDNDGELYQGRGQLYSCNSFLCPHCQKMKRGRSYRNAKAAIERLKPNDKTERWCLLTLTMPTLPDTDPIKAIRIFNRAFALFRKRKFFKDTVRAGIKGVELVPKPDVMGYHAHGHIAILTKFLERGQLVPVWTNCIEKAFKEQAVEIEWNAGESRAYREGDVTRLQSTGAHAVVDIRAIRSKRDPRGLKVETAISETVKYVSKPQDLVNLPAEHLQIIAEFEMGGNRWPRMVERLGEARPPKQDTAGEATISNEAQASGSVHVKGISDGEGDETESEELGEPLEKRPTMKELFKNPFVVWDDWVNELDRRWEKAFEFRRQQLIQHYPAAKFSNCYGQVWAESGEMSEVTSKREWQAREKAIAESERAAAMRESRILSLKIFRFVIRRSGQKWNHFGVMSPAYLASQT